MGLVYIEEGTSYFSLPWDVLMAFRSVSLGGSWKQKAGGGGGRWRALWLVSSPQPGFRWSGTGFPSLAQKTPVQHLTIRWGRVRLRFPPDTPLRQGNGDHLLILGVQTFNWFGKIDTGTVNQLVLIRRSSMDNC